ncbi:MAG: 3-hydroxyacyl-CoA dehydrogenase family protein [Candidatus Hodarchaeota archaeon]
MPEITEIAVLGAGAMGHGVAQVFAQAGCRVQLYDIDEETLNKTTERIAANLQFLAQYQLIRQETIATTLTQITPEPDLERAVANVDLILEAVPERLDLKREVFAKAETSCPAKAIFATTTSVIRVADIAEAVHSPERLVGTHWMNPPFVLPLVEVIRGPKTSESVIRQMTEFLEKKCGKRTIICNDTPGFIVNRLAGAVLAEAAKLIEEGAATHVEIDRAWKEHLGLIFLQYGPFGNLDYIGLDVIVLAAKYLAWSLNDDRFTLPKWLEDTVMRGNLGVKTGRGIYEYPNQTPEALREKRAKELLELMQKIGLAPNR